jgi:hypothetical protein
MKKIWLWHTCVLGAFALLWLVLPVTGLGADKRSVDESLTNQPQSSKPVESDVEKRLDQIDSDIETILGEQDKIKTKMKENRLQWSGSLRLTNNNYHFKDKYYHLTGVTALGGLYFDDKNPIRTDRSYGSAWVSRLRLTMAYEMTEKLRFYGQIVGYKYFNLTKSNAYLLDMVQTRYPLDSGLRVERAYFDWFITNWLVFSAGRIASPEGPPAELKENAERNATWGVQVVEAAMDAVMATFNLSSLIDSTYLRLSYLPYGNFGDAHNNDNGIFSNDGFKDMHVFVLLYEMKIPGLGSNVFQLGCSYVPVFGPRNNAIFINNDTLEGFGFNAKPDQPIFPEKNTPEKKNLPNNLGSYTSINAMLEVKNIAGIGLDLFGAYALTILNPTYRYMTYNVPYNTADNLQLVLGKDLAIPYPLDYVPVPIGLASSDDAKKGPHHGEFVFVGIRYSPT